MREPAGDEKARWWHEATTEETEKSVSCYKWTSVIRCCDSGSGGPMNFALGRSPGNNTSCLASQVTSFADRTRLRSD